MLNKLKQLQKKSLPILSNYPVAAIIKTKNNNYIEGVNVESEIPNLSICAERNAIFSAITKGYKPSELKEIHILGGNDKDYIITPCGVCRQLIFEMNSEIIIYMYNQNNKIKKMQIFDLLPSAFKNKEKI